MNEWTKEQKDKHSNIMIKYYETHPDAKKKKKWSKERKKKYSESRRKYYAEHPDIIEKMSKAQKRYCKEHCGSVAKGIKWSEEARKRHSKIQKKVQGSLKAREANSKRSKIRWSNSEERRLQSERIRETIKCHPEIREANSRSTKIRMNCPGRRKYQSEIMKKWWTNHSEEERKFHMHHARSFLDSVSKLQFKLFKQIKLYYPIAKLEYPVVYYHLDIALPEFKIDIEFDGTYWHQNPKRDEVRDKFLQKLGWTILRVREKEQFDINILHKLISQP